MEIWPAPFLISVSNFSRLATAVLLLSVSIDYGLKTGHAPGGAWPVLLLCDSSSWLKYTSNDPYGHHIQKPHSKSCRICQSWAVFKKNMFAVASATPRIFF